MDEIIRARSFGEILDAGFRIVRDRFSVLLAVTVIGYGPLGVLMAWLGGAAGEVPDPALLFSSLTGVLLYSLLVLPIVMAASTHVAGEWLLGRNPGVAAALRMGTSIYLPMVGTMFLWYLALIGLAGAVAAAFASAIVLGPFGFVVGIAVMAVGSWAFLGLLLVVQVMVLEGVFGVHPLRRSWQLLAGQRGRAFGVVIVAGLITLVLQGAFILPTLLFPSLSSIAQYLANGLGQALSTAVLCVLYVDVRCRKEAFDLEHLAQQVGEGDAPETV